jgi:hypothetical protein
MSASKRLLAALLVLVAALALTPAAQAKKSRGATTLALDPATAQALTDLGVVVTPLRPAATRSGGIAFPITTQGLNATTYAGKIAHSGGLKLAAGDTVVRLRNFVIRVDDTPDLTARVVGGPRISLLDLDLGNASIDRDGRRLRVSNVGATLSDEGAAALNGAFGTSFEEGLPIGTATVATKLKAGKRRGHHRG